ncbi:hypothetical protein ON010_g18073 [Phytophthora cinnamomi]|nr:hypothetical protein ON010_g18073 [Phytophthora cinnamomi]
MSRRHDRAASEDVDDAESDASASDWKHSDSSSDAHPESPPPTLRSKKRPSSTKCRVKPAGGRKQAKRRKQISRKHRNTVSSAAYSTSASESSAEPRRSVNTAHHIVPLDDLVRVPALERKVFDDSQELEAYLRNYSK